MSDLRRRFEGSGNPTGRGGAPGPYDPVRDRVSRGSSRVTRSADVPQSAQQVQQGLRRRGVGISRVEPTIIQISAPVPFPPGMSLEQQQNVIERQQAAQRQIERDVAREAGMEPMVIQMAALPEPPVMQPAPPLDRPMPPVAPLELMRARPPRLHDSRTGTYDSRTGTYDSRTGTYDSRTGTYDSRTGTTESDSRTGTTESDSSTGTTESDSSTISTILGGHILRAEHIYRSQQGMITAQNARITALEIQLRVQQERQTLQNQSMHREIREGQNVNRLQYEQIAGQQGEIAGQREEIAGQQRRLRTLNRILIEIQSRQEFIRQEMGREQRRMETRRQVGQQIQENERERDNIQGRIRRLGQAQQEQRQQYEESLGEIQRNLRG